MAGGFAPVDLGPEAGGAAFRLPEGAAAAASPDVRTGTISKSTKSFQLSVHVLSIASSSASMT